MSGRGDEIGWSEKGGHLLRQTDGGWANLRWSPPFAANHQTKYRMRGGDIFDVKRELAAALSSQGITVRGCRLLAVLEQSADRKCDYGKTRRLQGVVCGRPGRQGHDRRARAQPQPLYSCGSWEWFGQPAPRPGMLVPRCPCRHSWPRSPARTGPHRSRSGDLMVSSKAPRRTASG